MKFVVIGNGAAGHYAVQTLLKNKNEEDEICLISEEEHISYHRPTLSHYLGLDELPSSFYIKEQEWYEENGIILLLKTFVNRIDNKNSSISTSDGRTIDYDRLIIANGGRSHLPSIKGVQNKGVYTLKCLNDANEIKEKISQSKRAIIVGGGLLGLEAADAMMKSGLEVTIVEYFDRLLARQLDIEGSRLLEKEMRSKGVNIVLSDSAMGIEKKSDESLVLNLSTGRKLETDMILFSVGIRPSKEIINGSDIKAEKGVVVNTKMETNIDHVYACGDVAQLDGRVYGNWMASMEMGKTAAMNSMGDEKHMKDFVPATMLKSFGTTVYSIGNVMAEEDVQRLGFIDEKNGVYKKMFFKKDVMIGGILMGDVSEMGKISKAVKGGMTKQEAKELFL